MDWTPGERADEVKDFEVARKAVYGAWREKDCSGIQPCEDDAVDDGNAEIAAIPGAAWRIGRSDPERTKRGLQKSPPLRTHEYDTRP